jgi:hypothetical protein
MGYRRDLDVTLIYKPAGGYDRRVFGPFRTNADPNSDRELHELLQQLAARENPRRAARHHLGDYVLEVRKAGHVPVLRTYSLAGH